MDDPVLDTMVLQAFLFGDPEGAEMILAGLGVQRARFPAEVYNLDENDISLDAPDGGLSEFARGIRFARRKTRQLPATQAERYVVWLSNVRQLAACLEDGRFYVDPLQLSELVEHEAWMERFGIGKGEAARLVLAGRRNSRAVFLSSDSKAGRAARELGLPHLTIEDVLARWIDRAQPSLFRFHNLISGMQSARFTLPTATKDHLERLLRRT